MKNFREKKKRSKFIVSDSNAHSFSDSRRFGRRLGLCTQEVIGDFWAFDSFLRACCCRGHTSTSLSVCPSFSRLPRPVPGNVAASQESLPAAEGSLCRQGRLPHPPVPPTNLQLPPLGPAPPGPSWTLILGQSP